MKTGLRILFLLIGLSIFGFFIHQTGWDQIWPTLSRLGWLAPLCFVPFLSVFALDAAAWKLSFGKHGTPGVSWWSLFKIRWAGESVNYVVPTAYVGGEAVKVYLLHKRGIDVSYETVRVWWNRFGPMFASEIRNRQVDGVVALPKAGRRTVPDVELHAAVVA